MGRSYTIRRVLLRTRWPATSLLHSTGLTEFTIAHHLKIHCRFGIRLSYCHLHRQNESFSSSTTIFVSIVLIYTVSVTNAWHLFANACHHCGVIRFFCFMLSKKSNCYVLLELLESSRSSSTVVFFHIGCTSGNPL